MRRRFNIGGTLQRIYFDLGRLWGDRTPTRDTKFIDAGIFRSVSATVAMAHTVERLCEAITTGD